MRFIFANFSVCALLALANTNTAYGQAATTFDQTNAVAVVNTIETSRPTAASPVAAGTGTESAVVVRGKVKCPEGMLPGAVVHINGTHTYAVTNATGEFELAIPESTSSVEVTCSFAGFRDVVQHLRVKASPATIVLDKLTELPPRDRSAETGWW
jgi:uncharacterized protein YfaP (DUF2135 family)